MAEIRVDGEGGVAVVTVSDPARRNALSPELSIQLAEAVAACEADEGVHAMVVTGEPPAFCAGADLSLLGAGATAADREQGLRAMYSGFLAVAACPLPTVAAVAGPAVGAGLNLALACDVRLAGPSARFDARFLKLGLHPGGGMTWLINRAVGPQTAAALALFGEVLDATEAQRLGLVLRVVSDRTDTAETDGTGTPGGVLAAAIELARRAAAAPRELVLATKRSVHATAALTEHADAVELELGPQLASISSPAFAERIAAARSRR
jgi:enoyl-CoA hydratase